jgi:hypothetical protein
VDKKTAKKARKLQERIDELTIELTNSLGKKTHNSAEMDIAGQMRKIATLNAELKGIS